MRSNYWYRTSKLYGSLPLFVKIVAAAVIGGCLGPVFGKDAASLKTTLRSCVAVFAAFWLRLWFS